MSIKVSEISKLYGKQKALDNVSFEIKTGEIVGFLGPNGAGKSTMMKIITGYIPQTSGDVFVNNINVLDNNIEIRKDIGYLPENNPLYLDMYVTEYLNYIAGIYKIGKEKKNRINEIIEKTGLQTEKRKKIGALSKGYRQRVGLAQALLHNPGVLILDEPTSGLDPNQIVEIRGLISEIGKEKTVLLSTHIMQEVEAICDSVIIINNGKIVAKDKTEKIQGSTTDNYQAILVEFNNSIDTKKLKALKGVKKIIHLKGNNWLIQADKSINIRESIFNFAVKNKYTVLSMQKQEKSLEEIFQELTK
ncbi:MAG: gliding motility-associated ABC transporter ATP-binding subunit GldA [Chlorobi bacterium]|nr:gliding motility-associated ABC transporter ATP-binding subunit GldA [Chlorobiota bacterium]